MQLKIGILGTRGIPNHYGGFEQVAAELAARLVIKGHLVTVYNSSRHPYRESSWAGVEIVVRNDPQRWLGTAGQFIYDLNCILHARRRQYDVLLILGYSSSSVWRWLYPRNPVIVTNMDGLEWKRKKFSAPVRWFLKNAERWAVQGSDFHIADSPVIKAYLDRRYSINAHYISYGAHCLPATDEETLRRFGLRPNEYFVQMARMEPENNLETVLDAYRKSDLRIPIIVIGTTETSFGRKMLKKYQHSAGIIFAGALFDERVVASLLSFCRLYLHGHSVGGTNPSLLQAMAAGAPIAAHSNAFNHAVLHGDASYFGTPDDLVAILRGAGSRDTAAVSANLEKIRHYHSWATITDAYEQFFIACLRRRLPSAEGLHPNPAAAHGAVLNLN